MEDSAPMNSRPWVGIAEDENVAALVSSASRWMGKALAGWVDDDPETVGLLAPISVEHLGKAVLWSRNPALLVPLSNSAEQSLLILTSRPNIANPKLRTIGLGVLLDRLERTLGSSPLAISEKKRLIDTRNGSVHVGAKSNSSHVLRDALRLCSVLLADIGTDPGSFFGDQHSTVVGILDAQRTEVEERVLAKEARARNRIADLEAQLGSAAFAEAEALLEAEARDAFDSIMLEASIDHPCPICTRNGRLGGFLDVESDVDWDVEKIGESYESCPGGFRRLLFTPITFGCNVCKLSIDRYDELTSAKLPAEAYEIGTADLDDDFDLELHAQSFDETD
ncbi:hypothetical protein [Brevibacterium sp. 'Marine']|uniref:hypothetical protein n=1 Tax=Brevibacterium sp. 'Marine' TaxID=2725563 RepID=UPI00145F7ED7|nr:hypothetical protein [Brevibacterium sp. 'Marine']